MKLNLFSKTLPAFGLDISGGSFKIMQLDKVGSGIQVKAYSDVALPKGLVLNDEITDMKTFDYLLKQTLDKPQFGRLGTNFVVSSLPESKSFVRVVQIPKMSESEAENAVPYEAENFIPLPLDQVYLDWQKIGESGDKMNILMIATPKAFVDKYLEILDTAGLKTIALEVESQSCLRALIPQGSIETALLIDLDAFRSSLIMVEDGNIQFTSTIPVAGNTFTEGIARILGVSSAKAEQIKTKVGISNTAEYPNIQTALLPVLNNLSSEIKNILKFHTEHSGKQVQRVVLLGGSSKLKNLPEFLGPQLQDVGITKVELANPWQNLPELINPPLSPYEALSFVTALGLAKRGLEYEVT
jgi:type IV pilus assembly protein PilM